MHVLADKTALVTGSVTGIGLAIAEALAQTGMRIAIHGLVDQPTADKVAEGLEKLGASETRYFDADLRDPDAVNRMMQAMHDWGGVDILVNNAGMQKTLPLGECDHQFWQDVLAVNLTGAFLTMQHVMPGMAERGYGRVVNIASVHGLVASVNKAPYVTSKFGLIGLSRVVALEYAALGEKEKGAITVNCICPGWTETPLIEPQVQARAAQLGGDREAGIVDLLKEKQPSRRTSSTKEIGELALWLCQPIAHNITGAAIPVDGGWTAQ